MATVLIPSAGAGKRRRPDTFTVPKLFLPDYGEENFYKIISSHPDATKVLSTIRSPFITQSAQIETGIDTHFILDDSFNGWVHGLHLLSRKARRLKALPPIYCRFDDTFSITEEEVTISEATIGVKYSPTESGGIIINGRFKEGELSIFPVLHLFGLIAFKSWEQFDVCINNLPIKPTASDLANEILARCPFRIVSLQTWVNIGSRKFNRRQD